MAISENSNTDIPQQPQINRGHDGDHASPESSETALSGTVTGTVKIADASAKARDVTTQVLDFLSNASNETLVACIIGLFASTWLVLGRVGLVLIGVIGGIVLHATWEGNDERRTNSDFMAVDTRKRKEKGLDIVRRMLDWRERAREVSPTDSNLHLDQKASNFSGLQPETSEALTELTDTIIRDYVKYVGFVGLDNGSS